MRGYITKTQKKIVLTIRDNNDVPHRYRINNFKKFCKNVLHTNEEEVKRKRSIGQFIVDKLGFVETELWELDTIHQPFYQ